MQGVLWAAKDKMKLYDKTSFAWNFHNPNKPLETSIGVWREVGTYSLYTLAISSRYRQTPRVAVILACKDPAKESGYRTVRQPDFVNICRRLKRALENPHVEDFGHFFGELPLHKGENFQDGVIRGAREIFSALGIKDKGDAKLAEFSIVRKTFVESGEENGKMIPFDDVLRKRKGLPETYTFTEARMYWDWVMSMT